MEERNAHTTAYHFLDCGNGRRLEDFSGVIVSRPASAAADIAPSLGSAIWQAARLAYSRERGWQGEAPADWQVELPGNIRMTLRPASAGQTGVFPEHATVADEVARRAEELFRDQKQEYAALNLFAHTGLLTLRLAAINLNVAHVDASKTAVRAARENAALSNLAQAPVRWLVDDAQAFMQRESRREKRYSLIAADPPSFGRAEKGMREWKFDRDIEEFLGNAAKLFAEDPALFCLTCHSAGWTPERLAGTAKTAFPQRNGWKIETNELTLRSDAGGNNLPAGIVAYIWRA